MNDSLYNILTILLIFANVASFYIMGRMVGRREVEKQWFDSLREIMEKYKK